MSQTTLASMFLVCVNIMKSDYEIVDKIITDLICIIKLTSSLIAFNVFLESTLLILVGLYFQSDRLLN